MLNLLSPSNLGAMAIVAVLAFSGGYMTANRINAAEEYKAQVAELQQNIKVLREDKAQASVDNVKLEQLAKQTKDAADALLDPNGECFDSRDAEQLRSLWK